MQRYTLFGNHQNFSTIIFKNKATFSSLLTNIKGNPYKRCHFWTKSLGTTSSKCWYAQSINDEIAGIRDLPVSVSEYSTFGGTCGKTSRRRFLHQATNSGERRLIYPALTKDAAEFTHRRFNPRPYTRGDAIGSLLSYRTAKFQSTPLHKGVTRTCSQS